MNAVARRMSRTYPAQVTAVRYGEGLHEVDGFMVWMGPVAAEGWMGPTLHVPVRRRLTVGRWSGGWREVESVAAAASRVGRAIRAYGG